MSGTGFWSTSTATEPKFVSVPGSGRPEVRCSPEWELLLLCSQSAPAASSPDRLRCLAGSGIDWERLVDLALQHGLAPLLYRGLSGIEPSSIPKGAFATLWSSNETATKRKRAMAAELLALLQRFDEAGIPALPFKGPTLAELLYGDVALREFGDLDILVPSRALLRAKQLIESRGYESLFPMSPRGEARALQDERHAALAHVHPGTGIMVELHWKTDCPEFELPGIDDAWWERRPRVDFLGMPVRALTPEEYVYLLCMHGTRHHWTGLGWVADFARMVRIHPDLEWQQVLDKAERQGTLRILLLGLELARQSTETPLQAMICGRIAADPGIGDLASRIVHRYGITTDAPLTTREKFAFELAWFRFWPRWLGYILKFSLLPNMADWSRWDLPPAVSPLYYPLHFFRLLSKYGARPDKKYFND